MVETMIPVLILAITLFGCRRRDDEDFLSVQQGNALKGAAALLLVVVHIRERLAVIPTSYKVLAAGGYLLVSVFFFYSGFGITKKSLENRAYLSEKLPKRILYLVKLIVLSEVVYYLDYILLFGREISFWDMIKCITGVTMLNGALWTVVAMLVIQTIIFIGSKAGSEVRTSALAAAGCAVYILITALRGRGAWEMQSCCAFFLGSVLAEREQSFRALMKKRSIVLPFVVLFAIGFVMPYAVEHFAGTDVKTVRVIAGTVSSLTFILCMLWVIGRVRIQNRFVVLMGSLFTEIYLWHGLILDLMKKAAPVLFEEKIYYTAVSIAAIVVVVLVSIVIKKIETRGKVPAFQRMA